MQKYIHGYIVVYSVTVQSAPYLCALVKDWPGYAKMTSQSWDITVHVYNAPPGQRHNVAAVAIAGIVVAGNFAQLETGTTSCSQHKKKKQNSKSSTKMACQRRLRSTFYIQMYSNTSRIQPGNVSFTLFCAEVKQGDIESSGDVL